MFLHFSAPLHSAPTPSSFIHSLLPFSPPSSFIHSLLPFSPTPPPSSTHYFPSPPLLLLPLITSLLLNLFLNFLLFTSLFPAVSLSLTLYFPSFPSLQFPYHPLFTFLIPSPLLSNSLLPFSPSPLTNLAFFTSFHSHLLFLLLFSPISHSWLFFSPLHSPLITLYFHSPLSPLPHLTIFTSLVPFLHSPISNSLLPFPLYLPSLSPTL